MKLKLSMRSILSYNLNPYVAFVLNSDQNEEALNFIHIL